MAEPLQSAIEPDRIRERLVDLVRYPSFDGYEENVVERIGEHLRSIGAEVDVWYDDAATLATLPGYPGHEVSRARVPVVAARLRGSRPGGRRHDHGPRGRRAARVPEPVVARPSAR